MAQSVVPTLNIVGQPSFFANANVFPEETHWRWHLRNRYSFANFVTILTPILLTTATIMPILYDILAATVSTSIGYFFANHFLSLLRNHFTWSTSNFYLPDKVSVDI